MGIPNQTPPSVASDYASLLFVIQQRLLQIATSAPVRVMSCTNEGGLVPAGTISAQLLIDMQLENGQTMPHGTLFQVPYLRLQGGSNAVIIDPQPGDLGVCIFCMRDISALKGGSQAQAAVDRQPTAGATPASKRVLSLSDGVYLTSILTGTPTQYFQFTSEGITVLSPTLVKIQAPTIQLVGNVQQTDGTITAETDVIADGISLHDHVHINVTAGSSDSGPPKP